MVFRYFTLFFNFRTCVVENLLICKHEKSSYSVYQRCFYYFSHSFRNQICGILWRFFIIKREFETQDDIDVDQTYQTDGKENRNARSKEKCETDDLNDCGIRPKYIKFRPSIQLTVCRNTFALRFVRKVSWKQLPALVF